MENNLNNQKPVEFFSAERIKIEIDGQQILWRDMNLEIESVWWDWSNTNIGFSSGGFSSETTIQGAKVDVKGGIIEIRAYLKTQNQWYF